MGRPFIPVDDEAIWTAIEHAKTNVLEEIRKGNEDVYALILVLSASTLLLLPPTYAITLGLLTKSDELGALIDAWEAEAFSALDDLDLFSRPTLVGVQCLAIHQLSLAHR